MKKYILQSEILLLDIYPGINIFFLRFYLFERERERELERKYMSGWWADREADQAGSQTWVSIPEPWDYDPIQRQVLN